MREVLRGQDQPKISTEQMIQLLIIGLPKKDQFLIVGPPGCGKTYGVKRATKLLGYKMLLIHPVSKTPIDLQGMPWIYQKKDADEPEAVFIPFGDMKEMITNTKDDLVVFIDDLGQATPAVQASLMQLIYGGMLEGHKISDKVRLVAASNSQEHKAGVSGVLEPVKSRFHSILHIEPDAEEVFKYLIRMGYDPMLAIFIRNNPRYINNWEGTKELVNSPSPRSIESLGQLMQRPYPQSTLHALYAGAVGTELALAFVGFLHHAKEMPDPIELLKNPNKVSIDHCKPDILFALCGAITGHTNESQISNAVRVAIKMDDVGAEYSALLALMLIAKFEKEVIKDGKRIQLDNPVLENKLMQQKWIPNHNDILLG